MGEIRWKGGDKIVTCYKKWWRGSPVKMSYLKGPYLNQITITVLHYKFYQNLLSFF